MRHVLRDIGQFRVRPRRRALIAVPVLLGTVVALAGCSSGSGDDEAAAPALTSGPDADSAACTGLLDRLPATVLSKARNTAPEPAGLASWGDPAISLSCGATPTGPTADQSLEVDGICWVIQETPSSYTFLTYGRDPAVQVQVPTSVERSSATGALVDLNDAVAPLQQTERRCYGLEDTEPSATAAP